jgi:hypothetical protein
MEHGTSAGVASPAPMPARGHHEIHHAMRLDDALQQPGIKR